MHYAGPKQRTDTSSPSRLPGFITNLYLVMPSQEVQADEPFAGVFSHRWPLLLDIKFSNGALHAPSLGLPIVCGHLSRTYWQEHPTEFVSLQEAVVGDVLRSDDNHSGSDAVVRG